jgi:hypothetical protein
MQVVYFRYPRNEYYTKSVFRFVHHRLLYHQDSTICKRYILYLQTNAFNLPVYPTKKMRIKTFKSSCNTGYLALLLIPLTFENDRMQ